MEYSWYELKVGDTLKKIAEERNLSVMELVLANPHCQLFEMEKEKRIKVPTYSSFCVHIVNGKYTSGVMQKQLLRLRNRYPFLYQSVIGKSVDSQPIYGICFGEGKRRIHINAAHHGNEWITSAVVLRSLEVICDAFTKGVPLFGYDLKEVYEKAMYEMIPMVNPDGVNISQGEVSHSKQLLRLIGLNEGVSDLSRWKANGRGVDLNRNYDAGFLKYYQSLTNPVPSFAGYCGSYVESEPESKALADLTRYRKYDMVFAYHTQGEVIYWDYDGVRPALALEYGRIFASLSQYELDIPEEGALYAGYKDWFISQFQKPGYTIECGHGTNPIDPKQLDEIVCRTLPILLAAAYEL